MFIPSQREFGGKTELAEYGFDYRDLYQRWNGAFDGLPILPPPLCVPYSRRLNKPFRRKHGILKSPWYCPKSTIGGSGGIWGLVLVEHREPLHSLVWI